VVRRDLGTVWNLRAPQTILASGAVARMPAFTGNDLPGVMTAAAMRRALVDWGVLPGPRIAVFTCSDEGVATAEALRAAGAEIVALVDVRRTPHEGGWQGYPRSVVRAALGADRIEGIEVEGPGGTQRIACDGLAVAAGWSPQIAPLMGRVRPIWNPAIAAWLVPPGSPEGVHPAGAAGGSYATKAALKSGFFRARRALMALGRHAPPVRLPSADNAAPDRAVFWYAPGPGPAFVDFAGGVTMESLTEGAKPEEYASIAGRYVADPRLT
jgi:sarcosine oxidase subunit alpha